MVHTSVLLTGNAKILLALTDACESSSGGIAEEDISSRMEFVEVTFFKKRQVCLNSNSCLIHQSGS